jgi:acetyl esterase/lipase
MNSDGRIRGLAAIGLFALLSTTAAQGQDVRFEAGIVFAEPAGEPLKLDMARPAKSNGPCPAVVCIHGGGFSGGRREDYDGFCRTLARHGYAVVTIDYRLSPKHRWPAHIHDCKAAIRWLRSHAVEFGIDPDRIGAMGSSAGGHLAQFLGVTNDVREFDGDAPPGSPSSKVSCVAAWAQASDFTREYGVWKDAALAFQGFLGADLTAETRKLHVRASPLFWVTPNAAPTLLVHGTVDKDVLFIQSVWIYERLASAEVHVTLFPVDGGGHGLTGSHLEQAERATIRFFDRQFGIKR